MAKNMGDEEQFENQMEMSKGIMDDIRNSVMVMAVNKPEKKSKEITLADFKMIIVLGKGTFGKVFLAEFQQNKQLYAIKVIRKDILIEYNQIKNTKLEKDIMFKCQHQFLVGMEYLFMSDLRLFFVMPFIRGGELYRFFKAKRRFAENEVKFYAA
jgi:serine/threonine protein kinase